MVLSSVIEQSVPVFDGFVNCLGGVLINMIHDGLEKTSSDNSAEYPVALKYFSGVAANSVSWSSDRKEEGESGPCNSRRLPTGSKTSCHHISGTNGRHCYRNCWLIKVFCIVFT